MATLRIPSRISIRNNQLGIPHINLKDFNIKKDKILILRQSGGLGDILMHRMIFEDFKLLDPEIKIVFALPQVYFPAVCDHPFIDEIVDCEKVNPKDFLVYYITTTVCGRYENMTAPYIDKHRSDIWAEHCGVKLTKHEMHITLTEEEKEYGKRLLNNYSNNKKVVLFSPISAMQSKNLDGKQINGVIEELTNLNFSVVVLHNNFISELDKNIPLITHLNTRQWFSVINAADAIISVDTSTFHCAGGMKKPLIGIYTWADSTIYGKHYDFIPVQKHRDWTPKWNCGPCFKWYDCPKCDKKIVRKPCVTEITVNDIMEGFDKALHKWPYLKSDKKIKLPIYY